MHFHWQEYNSEQAQLMLDRVKPSNAHLSTPHFRGGNLNKERMETIMRNNYEASEVFEFGRAHDVVMGRKPDVGEIDAVLGFPYKTEPLENDIDEGDE